MLSEKELQIMRENAKVHKRVFDKIKEVTVAGTKAADIDKLALEICQSAWVLSAFTWVYWYKYTLQTSVNDVVVHGRPLESIVFQDWDVVTFDFWVKDKQFWICTDAAFTMIVGNPDDYPEKKKFLEVGLKALKKWLEQARVWNTVWDIGAAIDAYVSKKWYHIIRDLTGHGVGKSLHEQPYIYNYGTPGTGTKLKAGMTIAIEPIIGFSSGNIVDHGDWEIYVDDGSIGCQFEHTILITNWDPEIIV